MFPHNREVHGELRNELMGIMIHAGLGELQSPAAGLHFASRAVQMT